MLVGMRREFVQNERVPRQMKKDNASGMPMGMTNASEALRKLSTPMQQRPQLSAQSQTADDVLAEQLKSMFNNQNLPPQMMDMLRPFVGQQVAQQPVTVAAQVSPTNMPVTSSSPTMQQMAAMQSMMQMQQMVNGSSPPAAQPVVMQQQTVAPQQMAPASPLPLLNGSNGLNFSDVEDENNNSIVLDSQLDFPVYLSLETQDELVGLLFKCVSWLYANFNESQLKLEALELCWAQLFLLQLIHENTGLIVKIKDDICSKLELFTQNGQSWPMLAAFRAANPGFDLSQLTSVRTALKKLCIVHEKLAGTFSEEFLEATKLMIYTDAFCFVDRQHSALQLFASKCKNPKFAQDQTELTKILFNINHLSFIDSADLELIFFKSIIGNNNTVTELMSDILLDLQATN